MAFCCTEVAIGTSCAIVALIVTSLFRHFEDLVGCVWWCHCCIVGQWFLLNTVIWQGSCHGDLL